jgi:nicotinamide mononucleotide adenylyltransferase
MESDKLQIVYFPYLFFHKYEFVEFLDLTVSNFNKYIGRIEDETLKDKVRTLVFQNQILGRPIESVGVVDIKGRDNFRPLTDSEIKKIHELRTIFFLAGIAKCNTDIGLNSGHSALTSDNFKIIIQNFKLDSAHTGYTIGGIVRLSDYGYKISEIKYEKPNYVLKNPFSFQENYLQTLVRLRNKNRKLYRLIIRATDAIMNAYSNSEDVSHESRILEMCRAFEILFQLPESHQRKAFKEAIQKYCEPPETRKWRYTSERSGKKRESEKGSRHVFWADRFYTLRNHIIHGEAIRRTELSFYNQTHCQIALWFFLIAVKQLINEAFGKKCFYDYIKYETGKFIYDNGIWKECNAKMLLAFNKSIKLKKRP